MAGQRLRLDVWTGTFCSSQHFLPVVSFDNHNDPVNQAGSNYYLYLTGEEGDIMSPAQSDHWSRPFHSYLDLLA